MDKIVSSPQLQFLTRLKRLNKYSGKSRLLFVLVRENKITVVGLRALFLIRRITGVRARHNKLLIGCIGFCSMQAISQRRFESNNDCQLVRV